MEGVGGGFMDVMSAGQQIDESKARVSDAQARMDMERQKLPGALEKQQQEIMASRALQAFHATQNAQAIRAMQDQARQRQIAIEANQAPPTGLPQQQGAPSRSIMFQPGAGAAPVGPPTGMPPAQAGAFGSMTGMPGMPQPGQPQGPGGPPGQPGGGQPAPGQGGRPAPVPDWTPPGSQGNPLAQYQAAADRLMEEGRRLAAEGYTHEAAAKFKEASALQDGISTRSMHHAQQKASEFDTTSKKLDMLARGTAAITDKKTYETARMVSIARGGSLEPWLMDPVYSKQVQDRINYIRDSTKGGADQMGAKAKQIQEQAAAAASAASAAHTTEQTKLMRQRQAQYEEAQKDIVKVGGKGQSFDAWETGEKKPSIGIAAQLAETRTALDADPKLLATPQGAKAWGAIIGQNKKNAPISTGQIQSVMEVVKPEFRTALDTSAAITRVAGVVDTVRMAEDISKFIKDKRIVTGAWGEMAIKLDKYGLADTSAVDGDVLKSVVGNQVLAKKVLDFANAYARSERGGATPMVTMGELKAALSAFSSAGMSSESASRAYHEIADSSKKRVENAFFGGRNAIEINGVAGTSGAGNEPSVMVDGKRFTQSESGLNDAGWAKYVKEHKDPK